jgi:hypothetical protein
MSVIVYLGEGRAGGAGCRGKKMKSVSRFQQHRLPRNTNHRRYKKMMMMMMGGPKNTQDDACNTSSTPPTINNQLPVSSQLVYLVLRAVLYYVYTWWYRAPQEGL